MEYAIAKYIHLLGIFTWASAASSLGLFMLYSMHTSTGCKQDVLRNFYRWMTNLEILGFTVAIVMGIYMLYLLKYRADIPWLNTKLMLVFLLILPLEIINFYFVNIHIPRSTDKFKAYKSYDLFNYIVAVPLILVSLYIIYLAVVKP